jgi:hypothetical protein
MPFGDWTPGSRLDRTRASHSYGFVLLLIAATYVLIVAMPDESWARSVLILIESATLAAAVWTSGLGWVRAVSVLAVFGTSVAVIQLFVGGSTMRGLDALLDLLLALAIVLVIGLGVSDQREVNRQSVTGAVCIYLLIGIVFTFVYDASAAFGSGPFFAEGTDGSAATRIYFSYVTLATLGYGDYSPSAQPGRSFAVAEALIGQLYLVTVVALLVGRFGQARRPST